MLRTFVLRASSVLALSLALVVPVLASASTYTVKSGDTLSAIAQREHVSVDQIVRLNHLPSADVLSEGEVLQLAATPTAATRRATAKHSKNSAPKNLARSHASASRVAVANGHRTGARRAHQSKHHAAQPADAQIAQHQALWIALHTGSSAPDFSENSSFAAAQRALALELRLTKTALRYLGVPYSWGGESFSGVDCSGFVQAVFRRNGIDLPRTADAQYEVGRRISTSGLQPGDLVFFETYSVGASHVGIYLGEGQFVHASSSNGVRVDSLSESYYANRFIGARREAI
jgi:cell wall-associated NlpC family hydrolase